MADSYHNTPPTPLAFTHTLAAEGSIAARVEFIKSPLSVSKRVGERGRREASGVCRVLRGAFFYSKAKCNTTEVSQFH